MKKPKELIFAVYIQSSYILHYKPTKHVYKIAYVTIQYHHLQNYFQRSSVYVEGIRSVLVQKIMQEKVEIFLKISNYNNLSCIIFCTKLFQYSLCKYCIQGNSTYFGLRVLTNFGLKVSADFWHKKYYKKNQQYSQQLLELNLLLTNKLLC